MKNESSNRYPTQPSAGRFLLLFFSSLLLGLSQSGAVPQDGGIPSFSEFAPGLYRGAQPTEEGYRRLKSLGIKTIVNFRNEKSEIEKEKKEAERLGMNYISIPWVIYRNASPTVAEKFLEAAGDPAKQPIFIHCQRGHERTGVMSALYYLRYEGLSEGEAYHKAFDRFPVRWYWEPFVKKKFDLFKSSARQK